jgi:hypothetical protein
MRPRTLRIALVSTLVGLALAAGVLVLGRSQQHTQESAQKATTTARNAQGAAAGAAVTGDRAQKTAGRADRRSAATVKFLQGKQGLPGVPGVNGKLGAPGRPGAQGPPGRPAVLGFTLADVIDGLSPRLVERLPSPGAVAEACGSACVGPRGTDGRDATDAQVDESVARRLPDALTANCGGSCVGPAGQNGADSQVPGPQGATGPAGPSPQPFSFTFTDGTGLAHTCTVDPNVGPTVVQACT